MNIMQINNNFPVNPNIPIPPVLNQNAAAVQNNNGNIPIPPGFNQPAAAAPRRPVKPVVMARLADGRHVRVPFVKILHGRYGGMKVIERALKDRDVVEGRKEEYRRAIKRIKGEPVRPFLRTLSRLESRTYETYAPLLGLIDVIPLFRICKTFPGVVGKIVDGTYQREMDEERRAEELANRDKIDLNPFRLPPLSLKIAGEPETGEPVRQNKINLSSLQTSSPEDCELLHYM
jgi:hypothetical protein